MRKRNSNTPLFLYKLNEFLGLYDDYSEAERILNYRLGWQIFQKNKKSFNQYRKFLLKRHCLKFFFVDWPFYVGVSIVILIPIAN